jgi:signal peptidase
MALKRLANAAVILAALVLLAMVALFTVVPRITHGAALTVLTGSMSPDLPVGSVAMTRSVSPGALHVGDVVTYQEPGTADLITHRIVAIDKTSTPYEFTFQGDRNPVPDPEPVPASAVRGKVWLDVPYLGTLRAHLGQNRAIVVLIGVVSLSAFSLWQFFSVWRDRRRTA